MDSKKWFSRTVSASVLLLIAASSGCGDGSEGDDAAATSAAATDADQDGFAAPADCNDNDSAINPGATEVCNGVDENCNGTVDDGFTLTTYYVDADADGFGSAGSSTAACSAPAGYSSTGTDCNDADRTINPGAFETRCNGIDENCSGALDDDSPDSDADGYDVCEPGSPGSDSQPVDCNDGASSVYPGAAEVCNDSDDNCNTDVDEGLAQTTYYLDSDGDRAGDPETTIEDCSLPAGYVETGEDCDDTDPTVSPTAPDKFGDGTDSNCNGLQDIIFTVAGTGEAGFGGDNGQALSALLNHPTGAFTDPLGNIYIADTENHRIRKFAIGGSITTVAGTGTPGYGGDGSYATAALLDSPTAMVLDATNNIYIADTENHRIRRINAQGTISTIAGTGTAGFSGDGGSPTGAMLNYPSGLAIDAVGNLFIADTMNHRIRQIQQGQNKPIMTIAGTGEASFSGDQGKAQVATLNEPHGLLVDPSGSLLVADTGNHCIRTINPLNDVIFTSAGMGAQAGDTGDYGQATYARLNRPTAIFVSPNVDVYIADSGNNKVRMVNTALTIFTVAGKGADYSGYSGDNAASTEAELSSPSGLMFDKESNLVIVDSGNSRVRQIQW